MSLSKPVRPKKEKKVYEPPKPTNVQVLRWWMGVAVFIWSFFNASSLTYGRHYSMLIKEAIPCDAFAPYSFIKL